MIVKKKKHIITIMAHSTSKFPSIFLSMFILHKTNNIYNIMYHKLAGTLKFLTRDRGENY